MAPTPIFILSLPGADAQRISRALAERLGGQCIDMEAHLAQALGTTYDQALVEIGEERFRAVEAQVFAELNASLGKQDGGGGAVVQKIICLTTGAGDNQPIARALTASSKAGEARIVFIDVSLRAGFARSGLSGLSAVALGTPRAMWEVMARSRRERYGAMADLTVDSSEEEPAAIAARIAEQLPARPPKQLP